MTFFAVFLLFIGYSLVIVTVQMRLDRQCQSVLKGKDCWHCLGNKTLLVRTCVWIGLRTSIGIWERKGVKNISLWAPCSLVRCSATKLKMKHFLTTWTDELYIFYIFRANFIKLQCSVGFFARACSPLSDLPRQWYESDSMWPEWTLEIKTKTRNSWPHKNNK